MISSLRGRLFAGILATVLVAVAVSLAIGIALTRDAVRDSAADQLSREADLLATTFTAAADSRPLTRELLHALPIGEAATPPNAIAIPDAPPARPLPGGEFSLQVGPGPPGTDVIGSRADLAAERTVPRVVSLDQARGLLGSSAVDDLEGSGDANGRATIDGSDSLYAARVMPTEGKDQILVLTRSAAVGGDDFAPYLGGLLLASGLSGLLAAAAAALLARRLSAPIRRASAASRDLAEGRRPEPLPEEGPQELATLARSFNEMTTQLEQAREAERSVLLSVSHELRTPLTAVRGYAEGVEDGTIDSAEGARVIAAESARLERLVKDLLALARLEQGVLDFRREEIDLGEIAEEARRRLALMASERRVELMLERNGDGGAGAYSAIGDPDRALQVVSNLIENAIRVSPPDSQVRIGVDPGKVVVSDDGPGIAAADIPKAFERFHLKDRVDRAGTEHADGSGLGLAIVRELTEGMGGSVELRSELGRGAEFTVWLPPVDGDGV